MTLRMLIVGAIIVASCMAHIMYGYVLGVENLNASFLKSLGNGSLTYRVALITNQTGLTQKGVRTLDVLLQYGLKVQYVLAPEHGIDGTVPAGSAVTHAMKDQKTNVQIVSLYETHNAEKGKRINESVLNSSDVIFFDIQDSGMRHYTYISTLFYALDSVAKAHKKIVVLDRPNLLGDLMEGPLVDDALQSFIGIAPIPLRYGMTIGELAIFFNKKVLEKKAKLYVVPMKHYNRGDLEKSLLAPLSPNLTNLESCYGYSFLGLMGEIEPFEVGVGNPFSFQVLLLPDQHTIPPYEWNKIKAILANNGVQSSYFSYYNPTKKKTFSGLKLHIADPNHVTQFPLLVDLLICFKAAGVPLVFKQIFDKAVGTTLVRSCVQGIVSREHLMQKVQHQLEKFMHDARSYFIYTPVARTTVYSIRVQQK